METILEQSTAKIKSKDLRKIERSQRLVKYYLLFRFAHLYSYRYLNSCLMKHENNYIGAESMSDMMNGVFGENTKPTDFLHDKDEIADKCIDITNQMKALEKSFETLGIDPEDVYAFCKEVEHGKKAFWFKSHGQMASFILEDILNYDLGIISKEEAEYKMNFMFNFKYAFGAKPSFIRRLVRQIDDIFMEVCLKRMFRRGKKM